jgi:hypothetical protein
MAKLLWIFAVGALSASLALPAPISFHPIDVKERFTASPELPPQAAPLTFHLIDINEVYSNADGTLQFVELLATFAGQTQIAQTRVTAFNAGGTMETLVFDFTANFPGLGRNQTILLATRAFEEVAGFAPNFVIPDRSISLVAGRVVFKTDSGSQTVDAVAYGMFPPGRNAGFGNPAPALPRDGTNSLTRRSNTRNNANDFVIAPSSPLRRDGRSAMLRGGQYMLALLSDTDEIIRFELATGDVVQRVPAGFDVENASGIDIGTATGVNNGNPFVVVTQVGQALVRLYDAVTLMQIGQFQRGVNDIGWDGVAFDGTNWIFSVPDGVIGDANFQGVDLINMTASVNTGQVVKFASLNLNTPNQPFDVAGGMGWAGPGVAVVSGFTGLGDPSLAQITINNNTLMRGPTITTQAGGAQPGVSGRLITIGAGHVLISVPGSADLRIINPRTGQPVGVLTISEVDFTDDVAPNNAISGLSSETTIAGPR